MGLEVSADTRISGWMHKGISCGQRWRVSICMEILTRPTLLFLDEPTSGLDSAASYHVVGRIARLARREGMTVVAAVHQPSTEVFDLFAGLCLLAYGRTIFFGPAADTNQLGGLHLIGVQCKHFDIVWTCMWCTQPELVCRFTLVHGTDEARKASSNDPLLLLFAGPMDCRSVIDVRNGFTFLDLVIQIEATVIGLCLRLKLMQNFPPHFKDGIII